MNDFAQWRDRVRREYRPELIQFYSPYFNDRGEAEAFIDGIHDHAEENPVPMRVLHTVERLVSLSRDIEEIRPGEPLLQLFFLMVSIEATHAIAFPDSNDPKVEIIIDFFSSYIGPEDQEKLLASLKRSPEDDRAREGTDLSIEIVSRILNEARNTIVHEGDFWGVNGFNFPDDKNRKEVALEIKEGKKDPKNKRVYRIDLTIDELRSVIIRGLIRFLESVSSVYFVSG